MVERWSIDGVTYCPVKKSDGAFVRYSDYAALETQLDELAAENERLTAQIVKATDPVYLEEKLRQIGITDSMATEALASTAAVKVKVKRSDILTKIALWSDDEGLDLSMGQGDDLASRILSALEPHPRDTKSVVSHKTANMSDKPEGHQEPVEDAAYWKGAYDRMSARNATTANALILAVGTLDDLASGVGLSRSIEQIIRELNDVASSGGCVLTRPSEQAVTEEMVVAATEEYFAASFKNTPSDAMRFALKAAMGAGG